MKKILFFIILFSFFTAHSTHDVVDEDVSSELVINPISSLEFSGPLAEGDDDHSSSLMITPITVEGIVEGDTRINFSSELTIDDIIVEEYVPKVKDSPLVSIVEHEFFINPLCKRLRWNIPQLSIILFAGSDVVSGAIKATSSLALSYRKGGVSSLLSTLFSSVDLSEFWSHVGQSFTINGVTYCFEATGSKDEILGEGKLPRVQITEISELFDRYEGDIAIRPFTLTDLSKDISDRDILKFVCSKLGLPYQIDLTEMLRALLQLNDEPTEDSYFCSELAAEFYQHFGCLRDSLIPSNFIPMDFANGGSIDDLLIGSRFGDEIIISKKYRNKRLFDVSGDESLSLCESC